MRNFNARFRLRDTDRHIRLVYTWFLLLMLAGFVFTFVWAHDMTQLTPKGLASPLSRVGCQLRGTHVVWTIIGNHAFSSVYHACRVYDSGACPLSDDDQPFPQGSHDMDFVFRRHARPDLSPWLITYVSPVFVLTMLTGDLLMVIGFLIMFVVPMYEMWWQKSAFMMPESDD